MHKKSILIIDDDPDLGDALSFILNEEGYHVRLAVNGNQGIEFAESEKPHLILLDWQMPQMSGEEVLNELETHKSLNKVPVILMSANINHIPEHYIRFRGHLPKPFDLEHLLKMIVKIFHSYSKEPRKKGEM